MFQLLQDIGTETAVPGCHLRPRVLARTAEAARTRKMQSLRSHLGKELSAPRVSRSRRYVNPGMPRRDRIFDPITPHASIYREISDWLKISKPWLLRTAQAHSLSSTWSARAVRPRGWVRSA